MQLNIEINLDNAAFEDCNGGEAARILRGLAKELNTYTLEVGDGFQELTDINGNRVGTVKVIA